MLKPLAFKTFDVRGFLVFGVSNVRYYLEKYYVGYLYLHTNFG